MARISKDTKDNIVTRYQGGQALIRIALETGVSLKAVEEFLSKRLLKNNLRPTQPQEVLYYASVFPETVQTMLGITRDDDVIKVENSKSDGYPCVMLRQIEIEKEAAVSAVPSGGAQNPDNRHGASPIQSSEGGEGHVQIS